jgi:predicted permease
MDAILNVALPIFAVMAAGYAAGRTGLLGPASTEALNRFVVYVSLPALIFRALAGVDVAQVFNWRFLAAYGGAVVVTQLLAMGVGALFFRHRLAGASLHGISAAFGNVGYMGIPLCIFAFGPDGLLPAMLAVIFGSLVQVTGAVVLIEATLHATRGLKQALTGTARSIVLNPFIMAPLAGLLIAVSGVELWSPLDAFLKLVGDAALPCALFAIGLFLVGRSVTRGGDEVLAMSVVKLFIQPALALVLAFTLMTPDDVWAKSAVVLAALPTAATAFVVAQQYDMFLQRASATVLVTTVVSAVTVSALLVWFGAG